MDMLTGVLYVLVPLFVGGLLVLVVDTYYLGRRVQTAIAARRRVQEKLQGVDRKLASSETKGRKLTKELSTASDRFAKLTAEHETQRQKLETMQDNLNRINDYAQELRTEKQVLQQKLETAEFKIDLLQQQFNRANDEVGELREKYEQTCKRLIATEVELKHAQKDLNEAQEKARLATRLQLEKQALEYQLTTAETQIRQIEGQIAAANSVADELETAETQLKALTAKFAELEGKLSAARRQLDYAGLTGKSQIEIVRGIGPVYARRLHEAGIVSLADLAQQTTERVSAIVGLKPWQNRDPVAWIEEARILASVLNDGESPFATLDLEPATNLSQTDP